MRKQIFQASAVVIIAIAASACGGAEPAVPRAAEQVAESSPLPEPEASPTSTAPALEDFWAEHAVPTRANFCGGLEVQVAWENADNSDRPVALEYIDLRDAKSKTVTSAPPAGEAEAEDVYLTRVLCNNTADADRLRIAVATMYQPKTEGLEERKTEAWWTEVFDATGTRLWGESLPGEPVGISAQRLMTLPTEVRDDSLLKLQQTGSEEIFGWRTYDTASGAEGPRVNPGVGVIPIALAGSVVATHSGAAFDVATGQQYTHLGRKYDTYIAFNEDYVATTSTVLRASDGAQLQVEEDPNNKLRDTFDASAGVVFVEDVIGAVSAYDISTAQKLWSLPDGQSGHVNAAGHGVALISGSSGDIVAVESRSGKTVDFPQVSSIIGVTPNGFLVDDRRIVEHGPQAGKGAHSTTTTGADVSAETTSIAVCTDLQEADCAPKIKPTSMVLYDPNMPLDQGPGATLDELDWAEWSDTEAVATGVLHPSRGTNPEPSDVRVTLSEPPGNSNAVFGIATLSYVDGSGPDMEFEVIHSSMWGD